MRATTLGARQSIVEISMSLTSSLFARKAPEPSYPVLPQVGGDGQSNIPGIYVVGELAGAPLVKQGLNAGHELAPNAADRAQIVPGP